MWITAYLCEVQLGGGLGRVHCGPKKHGQGSRTGAELAWVAAGRCDNGGTKLRACVVVQRGLLKGCDDLCVFVTFGRWSRIYVLT